MRPTPSEADFAVSLYRGNEPDQYWRDYDNWGYWTGWKSRHWPADILHARLRVYGFDLRAGRRNLCLLLEVVKGQAFTYSTRRDFAAGVRSAIGWPSIDNDPHYERIPTGTKDSPCTGIALEWRVVKEVDVPVPKLFRFPRLGWLKLVCREDYPMHELDCADLYDEGGRRLRLHMLVERNASLRKDAKEYWRAKLGGHLSCVVCGFDFASRYGELGVDFIEMHHVEPISEARDPRSVNVEMLQPICSNCHRIIHRDPCRPLSVADLRRHLKGDRERSRSGKRSAG